MTPYHAKLWATQLSLRGGASDSDRLGHSLAGARVDLNPHQVSAAVFAMQALRLGGPRGALLADEVGLGKTIEAGLLLAQYWAEGKRNLLLIVPAMLRKQWQAELADKFGLTAQVVDAAALRQLQAQQVQQAQAKTGTRTGRIWIVSYHYAARAPQALAALPWDLAVLDEAHRMRNGNRGGLMAVAIAQMLQHTPRILLTATPLQNHLLELHSLGQLLDSHLFGDVASFKEQFVKHGSEHLRNALLRDRLKHVCIRTLRRQVQEYVQFTRRTAYTQRFVPTHEEHALYEDVSEWLRTEDSVALPAGQRQLLTMVLRKLLASSTMAIAGALRRMIARVEEETGLRPPAEGEPLLDDFEGGSDTAEAVLEAIAATETF